MNYHEFTINNSWQIHGNSRFLQRKHIPFVIVIVIGYRLGATFFLKSGTLIFAFSGITIADGTAPSVAVPSPCLRSGSTLEGEEKLEIRDKNYEVSGAAANFQSQFLILNSQ